VLVISCLHQLLPPPALSSVQPYHGGGPCEGALDGDPWEPGGTHPCQSLLSLPEGGEETLVVTTLMRDPLWMSSSIAQGVPKTQWYLFNDFAITPIKSVGH